MLDSTICGLSTSFQILLVPRYVQWEREVLGFQNLFLLFGFYSEGDIKITCYNHLSIPFYCEKSQDVIKFFQSSLFVLLKWTRLITYCNQEQVLFALPIHFNQRCSPTLFKLWISFIAKSFFFLKKKCKYVTPSPRFFVLLWYSKW